MKTISQISISIIFVTLLGCSKSDNDNVGLPIVSFSKNTYETTFFSEGETEAPTTDWNGDVGLFSLPNSIDGVSINSTTGVVSWDESLNAGTNEINILATNSAGQRSVSIELENVFVGEFMGGYNEDPESEVITQNEYGFNFSAGGDLTATSTTYTGPGTYTINGNQLEGTYNYVGYSSDYAFTATIFNDGSNPYIEGFWSFGTETTEANKAGYFRMDLVK